MKKGKYNWSWEQKRKKEKWTIGKKLMNTGQEINYKIKYVYWMTNEEENTLGRSEKNKLEDNGHTHTTPHHQHQHQSITSTTTITTTISTHHH